MFFVFAKSEMLIQNHPLDHGEAVRQSSPAGPAGFGRNQPDREGVLPKGISIGRMVLSPDVSEKKTLHVCKI